MYVCASEVVWVFIVHFHSSLFSLDCFDNFFQWIPTHLNDFAFCFFYWRFQMNRINDFDESSCVLVTILCWLSSSRFASCSIFPFDNFSMHGFFASQGYFLTIEFSHIFHSVSSTFVVQSVPEFWIRFNKDLQLRKCCITHKRAQISRE